jgi:hypothetical protein
VVTTVLEAYITSVFRVEVRQNGGVVLLYGKEMTNGNKVAKNPCKEHCPANQNPSFYCHENLKPQVTGVFPVCI